jgi:hypothetical protein
MPPPPNLTAATALVVTANEPLTLDTSGATAPAFAVWFKYTTRPGEILISVYAHASTATTYRPQFSIWTGDDPGALVEYDTITSESDDNRPMLIPVDLVPVPSDFYFRVIQEASGVTPTVPLQFAVYSKLGVDVPAGAWLVTSDGPGFPLCSFGQAGEIYGHKTYTNGEAGVMLTSGVSAHTNKNTSGLTVYDADYSVLVDYPSSAILTGNTTTIATDRTSRFYVAFPGSVGVANAKVHTLDGEGALVSTQTFTGAIGKAAVRTDNTILYFTQDGARVRRWDLVNSVFLSDLYTLPASHIFRADILCLADHSILIPVRQTVSPFAVFVLRLAADGSVLNTITLDGGLIPTWSINRTANAINGTDFLIWDRSQDGRERFRQLVAATGAEVASVIHDRFDADGTATRTPYDDMDPYGPQNSCPIFVAMVPFSTDGPAPAQLGVCPAALPIDPDRGILP